MEDLRRTLRALRRRPTYALTAVLSLALGIGANTAISRSWIKLFSGLFPFGIHRASCSSIEPGPLDGSASADEAGGPSFSIPALPRAARRAADALQRSGRRPDHDGQSLLRRGGTLRRCPSSLGNYFAVLGVRAARGRLIDEADDRAPGAGAVASPQLSVLAIALGTDPPCINRKDQRQRPPDDDRWRRREGFRWRERGGFRGRVRADHDESEITPDWNGFEDRRDHWVTLFARLKPGVTPEAAATAVNLAYRAQLEEDIAGCMVGCEPFLRNIRPRGSSSRREVGAAGNARAGQRPFVRAARDDASRPLSSWPAPM